MNRIPKALALLLAAGLAACSGHGSTPHTTPTPGPTSSAGTGGGSGTTSLSVQSVPSGMTVAVKTNTASSSVTTPSTVTPPFSDFATTLTFTPTNGAPAYVFSAEQTNNGNHTVLYNQTADTAGSIGGISTSSISSRQLKARAQQSSRFLRRKSTGSAGRPLFSSTRLIVHYRLDAMRTSGVTASAIERQVNAARGVDLGPARNGLATRVLAVAAGDRIDALASRLRARPEVQSVKPDALFYSQSSTPVVVNDSFYDNMDQWYLFKTQAANAWGYTTGSSSVEVAVIDTGVDTSSPDLAAPKVDAAHSEEIINGTKTPGIPPDTDGHGTNISGLVAAATNNNYGFASIGYNTTLQVYRVFPDGNSGNSYNATANESDIVLAIQDAVTNGAKVINLSLGTCNSQGIDSALQDAVESAISSGVTVVAASGNERLATGGTTCGDGSSTVDFPAAFDGVIAVGASALQNDNGTYGTGTEYVAGYSNSGPGLALVAPGGDPSSNNDQDVLHWIEGLYSTQALDPTNQCPDKSQCFALFAGTSQATPQVSGTVALMLAAAPGLTPAQIKQILISTADDINDPNQGGGRLDSYRALAAAKGDPVAPSLPTNLNFVAIAYTPNGTNLPAIIDATYTRGVPVASAGTFRVADIPSGAANYKIGIWYDANGDGKVDAGDWFGTSGLCSATAPCTSAAGLVAHPVAAGFILQ